jgi:hypothetical protein
LSELREN